MRSDGESWQRNEDMAAHQAGQRDGNIHRPSLDDLTTRGPYRGLQSLPREVQLVSSVLIVDGFFVDREEISEGLLAPGLCRSV
jgi:hypothetical protein